jgi:GT2 family glycosyltransferase
VSSSYEWPIAVRSVDVARPLQPLTGLARYSRVRVFVSYGQSLVGSVDIWNRGAQTVSLGRLRDAIAGRLAPEIIAHEQRRGLVAVTERAPLPTSTVSIIVPTCDRPEDLRRCLRSLLEQRTRHQLEILVVDNRPATGRASDVVREFPTVRLVREDRPGLSYARNAGIAHASGTIIVTTDDDVVAPDGWIDALVQPFARPEVAAVTGHVLPLELETEAQCRFEAYGGLGKGFSPSEVDRHWFDAHRSAVPTWRLGATANAAFRASVFHDARIGPLDEALGAGTPTGCSEDTYLFYRILKAGGSIVYEPSAFVWHHHRQRMDALRAQIYAYSKGHVAYQLTTWMREGDRRALLRLFWSLPKTYAERAWHRLRRWSDYPLSLLALELDGNLAGPYALWRSRRRVRRLGTSSRSLPERSDAVPLEGQVT